MMDYDIIIIGAGPAGLSFARALADSGLRLAVFEKKASEAIAQPAYDGREIALTHLSHKILQNLGMWSQIPADQILLMKHAQVTNGESPYVLSFDYQESGQDNLGFMVSNQNIRRAAYQSLVDKPTVSLHYGVEISKLGTTDQNAWVQLKNGKRLTAQMIVAADSRFSAARQMMGIGVSTLDFERTCIVCQMTTEKGHQDTAYEMFQLGRTLAILPLPDNRVSAVITLPTERRHDVLGLDAKSFAADIMQRTSHMFGEMELISDFYPYPLVGTYARQFYGKRFALIGDAAVGMHPVTAHGFNLGLRGAYSLAQQIQQEAALGLPFWTDPVLQIYAFNHRKISFPLYHGTNALVKLYTKEGPVARMARHGLLRLGHLVRPAKKMIMNQLTEADPAAPHKSV